MYKKFHIILCFIGFSSLVTVGNATETNNGSELTQPHPIFNPFYTLSKPEEKVLLIRSKLSVGNHSPENSELKARTYTHHDLSFSLNKLCKNNYNSIYIHTDLSLIQPEIAAQYIWDSYNILKPGGELYLTFKSLMVTKQIFAAIFDAKYFDDGKFFLTKMIEIQLSSSSKSEGTHVGLIAFKQTEPMTLFIRNRGMQKLVNSFQKEWNSLSTGDEIDDGVYGRDKQQIDLYLTQEGKIVKLKNEHDRFIQLLSQKSKL